MFTRVIETLKWKCQCGSNKFIFENYGGDGCSITWVNGTCKSCKRSYEISVESGSYRVFVEDKEKFIDEFTKHMRDSFAMEGINFSEENFQKVRKLLLEDNM